MIAWPSASGTRTPAESLSTLNGSPVRPETYATEFAQLPKDAGMPAIRLRHVRHTAATMLLDSGMTPSQHPNGWVTTQASATKSAARVITEGLRLESDPSIRVTTISPGVTETELVTRHSLPENRDTT